MGRLPGRFALVLAAVSIAASVAAPQAPGVALGVYRGAAKPAAVNAWGNWLGRQPPHAIDFFARDNWSEISSPIWQFQGWQNSPYDVVFSVPMVTVSGATLAEGASGAYDGHFVTLAQNLVAYGFSDSIIRLGWEFNGNWYAWSALNDPATFVTYWRRIVDVMRSVPGANFRFDWNPIFGAGIGVEQAYPGDAYVDIIGLDIYDQVWYPSWQDPATRWQQMLFWQYGLVWHRDFAMAHGKPMSFPEWGLVSENGELGGGDNPYFIERMYEWIGQNRDNVAYYAYFEFDGTIGNHSLMSGEFPNAAARFLELFVSDPPLLPHDPPLPGTAPPQEPLPEDPAADDPVADPPVEAEPPGHVEHVRADSNKASKRPVLHLFGAENGARVGKRPKLAVFIDGDERVETVDFLVDGRLECSDQTEPYRCRPTLEPGWHEIDIRASTQNAEVSSISLHVRFEPRRLRASAVLMPKVQHRRVDAIIVERLVADLA